MNDSLSLTETSGLGERLGEFTSSADRKRILLPSIFLVIGLIILFLFLVFSPHLDGFFAIIFLLLGVLFVGVDGLALIQNFREGNWYVKTFAEGMHVTYRGQDKLVRWPEIKSVKRLNLMSYSFGEGDGIPLGRYCIYTIEIQDGSKYTFSGMKVEQLGDFIYQHWKKEA